MKIILLTIKSGNSADPHVQQLIIEPMGDGYVGIRLYNSCRLDSDLSVPVLVEVEPHCAQCDVESCGGLEETIVLSVESVDA